MPNEAETTAKMLVERYKLYADKRKYSLDELKYFAWLDTTFIALNSISIGTGKLYGLVPVEKIDILQGICGINVLMLSYGLLKIIMIIHSLNNIKEVDHVGEYSWESLAEDVRLALDNDISAIRTMRQAVEWSYQWLSRGLGLNAVILILPLLPHALAWIKGLFA